MIEWMRLGYRACRERWATFEPQELSLMFSAIESAVDTFLKHEGTEYEGYTARIAFDIKLAYVTVTLQDVEDY